MRAIRALDVDVHVVTMASAARLRESLISAGVPTQSVHRPLPPTASSVVRLPVAIQCLRPLLRHEQFDLLHGSEPLPAIALGVAARLEHVRPVVYRRHHAKGHGGLALASRLAARLAGHTVVSCEANARLAVADDHVRRDRVLVARSGTMDHRAVDDDEVASLRAQLSIGADRPVIGVVARLRAEKGVDVLIHAAAHLTDLEPSPVIVVVGSGPCEQDLAIAAATSPGDVRLVGRTDDVALWLSLFDIAVMPSRREAFGQTTLEVKAAGRPLVASAVGGLVEGVEEGVDGLLVPPGDPLALAAALRKLIVDPVLRAELGAHARTRYERSYTIEQMACHWIDAWRTALTEGDR
jgi:glycosyltransferase involved in cell wall biosynthesis